MFTREWCYYLPYLPASFLPKLIQLLKLISVADSDYNGYVTSSLFFQGADVWCTFKWKLYLQIGMFIENLTKTNWLVSKHNSRGQSIEICMYGGDDVW